MKTWLLLLSVGLNILLLSTCMGMLSKARTFYSEYRFFRPMAHGTSESTTLATTDNASETVMVLFGDSRISQWDPLPQFKNTVFIDAGVAGETTTEMRRRIPHDVLRHQPDIVLVQSGMNDLTASITHGIQEPQAMIDEMKNNLRYFTEVFSDSGARVVLTPVMPNKPIGFGRRLFWHDSLDQRVAETNAFLQQLAVEQSVEWLDVNTVFYDQSNKQHTEWYIDALHVIPAAYEALNIVVEQHLETSP